MMDKEFNELIGDVKEKVNQSFGELNERDNYFLKTLDNFVYRYLEDDKCGPGKVQKVGEGKYLGSSRTHSMKLAMEYVREESKQALAQDIKEIIAQKKKPTMEQKILVDASDIDEQGQGKIIIKAILNWNFPEHQDETAQHVWTHKYESEDWSYLRKHLAIQLEEVCEHF